MADSQPVPEENLPAGDAEEAQTELEISQEGENKSNSDVEIASGGQGPVEADEAENVTQGLETREDVGTVDDKRSSVNSLVLEDGSKAEDAIIIEESGENVDAVNDKRSPENSQVLQDDSEQAALSAEAVHSDQDTEETNEDALNRETADANDEPGSNDLEGSGSTTEQKKEELTNEIDDEAQHAVAETSNERDSPSTVLTNDSDKVEETRELSKSGESSQRDNEDTVDQVEERTDPELQQASKETISSQPNAEDNGMPGNEVKEEHRSMVETALPGDALSEEKASVPQPLVRERMWYYTGKFSAWKISLFSFNNEN